MAYQKRLTDGRQAISLNISDESWEYPERTLASASPFVQPSLSSNGRWLVFVQLRPSFFALMRYDRLLNQYKEIRKVPRRKKLYHPSISDDGNIIGWTENKIQNRYLIKNLVDDTVTQIVNDYDGVEHGMVAANGGSVVYSINRDDASEILLHDLENEVKSSIGGLIASSTRFLSTQWQGSIQSQMMEDDSVTMLVNASIVGKDVLYPDTTTITLQFNTGIESDVLEQAISVENVQTGEVLNIGEGQPISWSYDETIYKEDENGVFQELNMSMSPNGCRPDSDEVCETVVDKTLVYLSVSLLDWEVGQYKLNVTMSERANKIPFEFSLPQTFTVDFMGGHKDVDQNEVEYFYRVFNENSATHFDYTFEISEGVNRSRSIEIGQSGASLSVFNRSQIVGRPVSGDGFLCFHNFTDTCEVSNVFVENQANFSLVRFRIYNDSDQALQSPASLQICGDEGECFYFNFDLNIPENPNYLPW